MTSKEESACGGAPLAGAVRPDEKTGSGGSAPAPVPAGDAVALALQRVIAKHDEWAAQMPAGAFDDPLADAIDDARAALSREWQADPVQTAWKAGLVVQYFQLNSYDGEWTDYRHEEAPGTNSSRLHWRVKPGQADSTGVTTT